MSSVKVLFSAMKEDLLPMPSPLLDALDPQPARWRQPVCWVPHLMLLTSMSLFVCEFLHLRTWGSSGPSLLLALAALCRIPVPPPLGLSIDALSAMVLRARWMWVAISIERTLSGFRAWLLPWVQPEGSAAGTKEPLVVLLHGPGLWALSAISWLLLVKWCGSRVTITHQTVVDNLDVNVVKEAQRSRPPVSLRTRLHPSLFPFKKYGVERIELPHGGAVDRWPALYPGPAECPVFLWIHGGAWKNRSSRVEVCTMLLQRLSARGWLVYSVDYRVLWPGHLDDCREAMDLIRRQCGNTCEVVVGGGSAGGHLAALMAAQESLGFRAAVLVYPAVDVADQLGQHLSFPWGPSAMRFFFGRLVLNNDNSLWEEATPLSRLTAAFPPCLIVHGDLDGLVPIESSRCFLKALTVLRRDRRDLLLPVNGAKHCFEIGGGEIVDVALDGIVAWLHPWEHSLLPLRAIQQRTSE